ncbi:MAG: FG-GAP-like repeat-containing protein [Acidobacteriia bacterium]|nr:FG-GAP-like repeat-containing protein [Terriglobia bacterium]
MTFIANGRAFRHNCFSNPGFVLGIAVTICFLWCAPAFCQLTLLPIQTLPTGMNPVSVETNGSTPWMASTADFQDNTDNIYQSAANGIFAFAQFVSDGDFDDTDEAFAVLTLPSAFGPVHVLVVAFHFDDVIGIFTAAVPKNRSAAEYTFFSRMPAGGSGPRVVRVRDFNKDGTNDIAVLCDGSGTLVILLGKPDGTFQPPNSIPIGSNPTGVVFADFNGDGNLDAAVSFSGGVAILLGKGDGTFQPPVNISLGPQATAIVSGDLNGDGKVDLAVSDSNNNKVYVLLGKGDGTFQPPQNFPTGTNPVAIQTADFDGDGKPDLITANAGSNNVSILKGNGDGTFQSAFNIAAGNSPSSLAVGDFNGDGRPDLVVSNSGSNNLMVFQNATGCPASSVFNATIPDGGINTSYNQNVATAAGSSYAFLVSGGALPAGLTLSTSGVLSGTPTQSGSFAFTVVGLIAGGCPITQNFSLAIHNTSVTLALAADGAGSASTSGTSSSVQVGYAAVASLGKDSLQNIIARNPLYGTAVFSVTQNGVVTSEVGVPASTPTTAARIFIDFRTGVAGKAGDVDAGTLNVDTGFAVVNRGGATANITFTLRDKNAATLAVGHGTLAAANHRALFIDQLNSLAPDFVLPANFATTSQFGTLEIQSDQPLSVVALRQTNNQRGDFLFTSTPVVDETSPGSSTPVYFAQLADGGGYKTIVVLVNPTGVNQTGQLNVFDNNGNPLSVTDTISAASGSTFPYLVKANGFFLLQTDGSPGSIHVGWVQLLPDGGTITPAGAGLFSYKTGGVLVTESGVPAVIPTTHALIYVDLSNGHDTGLAIGNPSAGPITLLLKAFQSNGSTQVGATTSPAAINVNGHTAEFVEQLVSGLPAGFTGVLDISCTSPFVALTLRALTNSRGDSLLTTFPIADFLQSAPALVFPQIADGGGFKTQFILLDTGGASNPTLNFFGDNGTPIAVGKRAP